MRFLYRHQDSERGVLEGEVVASSLSDAYSVLRKSGVRPMKVWAKPGLANRISAIGKRGAAIIVLGVVCLALAVFAYRRSMRPAPAPVSVEEAAAVGARLPEDLSAGFERFLSDRQQMEAEYRAGVVERLRAKGGDRETLKDRLDAVNASLRLSGIREVSIDEIDVPQIFEKNH